MLPSLLGLSPAALAAELAPLPQVRSWTARQVEEWLFDRKVASFSEMTNLPAPLRATLAERFSIDPFVVEKREAGEDGTVKLLLRLDDGARIEAVEMPDVGHTTLCLSSQAGCAADCAFCVTGRLGPGRNLSVAEIVGQFVAMTRGRSGEGTNVVFMGMGEPTANLPAVREAFERIARQVSPRRITLSTVGSVPGILEIASWPARPNLAVSLTAADDELRSRLMPVNRAWDLASLRSALAAFPLERGRKITLEVVLMAGVNDRPADARRIADWARGLPVKVNLIPLNEDPGWIPSFRRPDEGAIDAFCETLVRQGLAVTVRRSRGGSASAACGQLKGRETPARGRGKD
jgi:23S rRNA (adenine2503-C2)-methyltransferase